MRSVKRSSFGASRIIKISCIVSIAALAAGCSVGSDRFAGITGSTGNAENDVGSDVSGSNEPFSNQVSTTSLSDPSTPRYGSRADTNGSVRVSSGETLYSIAKTNKVDVKDLVAENDLQPPYQLSVGQRLRLPGASGASSGAVAQTSSPSAATPSSSARVHTVKNGETLYSLGRTYSVTPTAIASANSLSSPYSLNVGQQVRIPGGGSANGKTANVPSMDNASSAKENTLDSKPLETAKTRSEPLPSPDQRTSSKFRWPVKGRVLSSYGPKSNGSRNDGINIAVPEGTSVRAAENGVVAYAGNELKGYGNLVLLRHDGGWVTAYAHNQVLHVKRGDRVTRGSVIAKAGSTGAVTSPQVHFEVRKGAEAVDPMKHLSGNSLAAN
jgi:murein DD-endopeptidase MepM/ murein hydrolase activator NlpD